MPSSDPCKLKLLSVSINDTKRGISVNAQCGIHIQKQCTDETAAVHCPEVALAELCSSYWVGVLLLLFLLLCEVLKFHINKYTASEKSYGQQTSLQH